MRQLDVLPRSEGCRVHNMPGPAHLFVVGGKSLQADALLLEEVLLAQLLRDELEVVKIALAVDAACHSFLEVVLSHIAEEAQHLQRLRHVIHTKDLAAADINCSEHLKQQLVERPRPFPRAARATSTPSSV